LPEIGEQIRKGFQETQTKFNSFFKNLQKKIEGDDEDEHPPQLPARRGTGVGGQTSGVTGARTSSMGRRSQDYDDRYDADPEEINPNFLHLRDETGSFTAPR